jgi:hypothetical protein
MRFCAVQCGSAVTRGSEMQRGWQVNAPHVNRMETITRANFDWSDP